MKPSAGWRAGESEVLDLDVQHLATAVHPVLRVYTMRAKRAAIGRILGEFRRLEGVGRAAIGAAAFGLLAFRIGHGGSGFECRRSLKTTCGCRERVGVKSRVETRQAS